jgi:uncharacterized protein (TIGR02466 family)
MKKEYFVVPAFATPIYHTVVETISEKTKNQLFDLEFERLDTNNGWISKDKFIINRENFRDLKSLIESELSFYLDNILEVDRKIEFYITNSWIIMHDPGDYAQEHIHINSLLSGVLYLETNDESGDIHFQKNTNHLNLFPSALEVDIKNYNIFNSKSWYFKPCNNQLFFFPSSLLHYVDKNKSSSKRYSLAFNIFIKGRLGKDDLDYLEIK